MPEPSTVETAHLSRWPTGQCSGDHCHATVIWATTPRAERVPVDLEPGSWPDHNLLLLDGAGGPQAMVVVNAGQAFGRKLYRSHFASCPDARSFERRGTRRRKVGAS